MLCLFSKTHTYKCKVVVVAQGHTQAGKGSRNVLALLLQYSVLHGGGYTRKLNSLLQQLH